jgi:hypothetical protein
MIYQVAIKTSSYLLPKCCISSKYKKHKRLVTAAEVVVLPSKDTEMIVPSKVTETNHPVKN